MRREKQFVLGKILFLILFVLAISGMLQNGYCQQPPPPCHPNETADQDAQTVGTRGDVASVPAPLKDRLVLIAQRPHSMLPVQAYPEADSPSHLFEYYLLDSTGLQPNIC